MCHRLRSITTDSILNVLSGWFHFLGWPRSMRLDRGSQFIGLSYIVEFGGKEMLRSRGMIQPKKVASAEEGQGQISERRGISSDLDLQPLPLVSLRRSICFKEKYSEGNRILPDLEECARQKLKRKSCGSSGSCSPLLGQKNKQNMQFFLPPRFYEHLPAPDGLGQPMKVGQCIRMMSISGGMFPIYV